MMCSELKWDEFVSFAPESFLDNAAFLNTKLVLTADRSKIEKAGIVNVGKGQRFCRQTAPSVLVILHFRIIATQGLGCPRHPESIGQIARFKKVFRSDKRQLSPVHVKRKTCFLDTSLRRVSLPSRKSRRIEIREEILLFFVISPPFSPRT
ncbi:hypothetical protein PM082_008561 [Marasmius tenuissimus]|nr:hypothetical protein PM082_008561 [Marasmius tenuissimus]